MISNIGGGTYFVFAGFLVLAILFVFFLVPETKGLSMESMDALFGPDQANAGRRSSLYMDEEKATAETLEQIDRQG